MAPPPPTSLSDLTTVAQASILNKANATASPHPAKPAPASDNLPGLDSSKLTIELTTCPKPYSPPKSWGKADVTTDHMVSCRWNSDAGWSAPCLHPYRRLDLWPTASCLHYATECFEGLKAYRGFDGKIRLFRPSRNTARMLMSSTRIACPTFPPSELEKLITVLLSIDGSKWLPERGTFLYIRPTMIGTGRALGVQKPVDAMLFIVMTLFPKLDRPMKLLASSEDTIRAWPGGFGYAKVGANYGPSLLAQKEAQGRGYDQILWLLGKDAVVTEAGASNFFVVLRKEDGGRMLLTAPLDDKVILDGVTRRSILELARERFEDVEVVERCYTMQELKEKYERGELLEAFAAGTAFFVAPVTAVRWRDTEMKLPVAKDEKSGVTFTVKNWLREIMYGEVEHPWGVVVEERGFAEEAIDEAELERVKEELRRLRKSKAWARAEEEVRKEHGLLC